MSCTVAAAREASLLGIPAIAISQYIHSRREPPDQDRTRRWTVRILEHFIENPPQAGEYWNVNLPDPKTGTPEPEIVICPIDPGHHALVCEQTDDGYVYRGKYQDRNRDPGCDVDICFSGNIAVFRLCV